MGLNVGPRVTRITDLQAKKIAPGAKPVSHGAVRGLRLEPGSTKGHGKWILRFVSPATGKRRDMGLGVYPEVSIADAGIRGTAARQSIAGGRDPIETRAAEKAAAKAIAEALTFEQAARKLHESLRPGWKNSKHADQWINTLRDYVFPKIGKKKVAELAPAGFAEVLVDRI